MEPSVAILDKAGLYQTKPDYTELQKTKTGLYLTIMDYDELYLTIPTYSGLYQTLLGYIGQLTILVYTLKLFYSQI